MRCFLFDLCKRLLRRLRATKEADINPPTPKIGRHADFRNGDKPIRQPVEIRLQRPRKGLLNLSGYAFSSDGHGYLAATARSSFRFTSTILYASITSPAFTSLKFSRPIPHS